MYTEEQRQKLILFLFERMMAVLEGMRIYVATPDGIPDNRYTIIRDEWGDINRVVARARSRITDDLLILPCDLPFVEREDINLVIGKKIMIVPSQNGGTNALFLPGWVEFETQFGKNSFQNHINVLECRDLEYETYESDDFRDIDTEEDILWALEHRRESEFSKFVKERL